MKKMTHLLSGVLLALSLFGCSAAEPTGDCIEDADCGPGLFCTEQNTCACTTDDLCELALGEGYFCNNFGSCQVRPPCLGNQDCEEGEICNAANGGQCISADSCGSTVHCDFNEFNTMVDDEEKAGKQNFKKKSYRFKDDDMCEKFNLKDFKLNGQDLKLELNMTPL